MADRPIESYQDLRVWQLAMDLAVEAYRFTGEFPKQEQFGITSQIRRSASSIAANIAEGYGRQNKGSYIQFLRIAQGSLKELETHIILSQRVGFCSAEGVEPVLRRCDDIGRMLRALIQSLSRRQDGE